MSETEKKFFEKFLAIIFCVINDNIENKEIIHEYGKLNHFCEDHLYKYNSRFEEFGKAYDNEYILSYLIFSYKEVSFFEEIKIRRKCPENTIFHICKDDVQIFYNKTKELAPHIYDLIYLNWENEIFNKNYEREPYKYEEN